MTGPPPPPPLSPPPRGFVDDDNGPPPAEEKFLTMRSRLLHPKSFVDKVVVTTGETSSLNLARTTTTTTTLKTTSTGETHVTHNLEFTRDGSRLLSTTAGDDVLRVYEVPAKMIMMSSDGAEDGDGDELLKCALKMKLPKSHYDACWYPAAQGNGRETLLTRGAANVSGGKLVNVSHSSDYYDYGVCILSSSS